MALSWFSVSAKDTRVGDRHLLRDVLKKRRLEFVEARVQGTPADRQQASAMTRLSATPRDASRRWWVSKWAGPIRSSRSVIANTPAATRTWKRSGSSREPQLRPC